MKWYRERSIAFRILILLFLVLIPINILFVFSTTLSNRTYQDEIIEANESVLNVYLARLQSQMDQSDAFFWTELVSWSDLLTDKTELEREVACMGVYLLMQEELGDYDFPAGMFVFESGSDRIYMSYETSSSTDEAAVVRKSIPVQYETGYIYGWQIVTWGEGEYLFRGFQSGDLCYGVFIPVYGIIEELTADLEYENPQVLLVSEDAAEEASSGMLRMTSDTLSSGYLLIMDVSKEEINRTLPYLLRTLFAISLLMLGIIPLLYLLIRRVVIRPLMELDQALHRIEGGDLEYRIIQDGYAAEFVHIYKSFNHMLDEILQLRNEKYEYELERQKHEMISLQLQIKPHFLYNSFNDVSNMAQIGDYGGIREMMGYLAEYFRYTIRTGYELVPLQRELDFMQVYLSIMEMRHPGCFEYVEEIDPQMRKIRILPLLIHTFVENTMSHAVKEGNYITSKLTIRPEGGRVRIYITDDGEGIPEEILRQIEQKKMLKDEFGKEHVGIWNCYKRLQIYYHGDADITISSVAMQGTQVMIDMPWEKEETEAETDETPDRG